MRKDSDDLVNAVIQKERALILKELKSGVKHISKLSEETGLDRATVSYHLGILEIHKVVSSEYEMLREPHSKGRIGRYYTLNQARLEEAIKAIQQRVGSNLT
ncbi:MAG: helix-turn-helix domain-containing protein [Thaumarchaeota archaeon]|nr:helix-turn-helix domain-containing protein [Nitrososphaerota archaeon]MCL5317095.1 helix-turn-helix domain-containing protein [Nitrososphaerota archaeon]